MGLVEVMSRESVVESEEPSTQEHLLDVAHDRICDCPGSHISCIDAKSWIKDQLGVWQFNYNGRDIRDKNVHPVTFAISLVETRSSFYPPKWTYP